MSRKTPARFDDASEEFYIHVSDMQAGDRVILEGHVFVMRQNGSLYISYDLIDYVNCTNPHCGLWEEISRGPLYE